MQMFSGCSGECCVCACGDGNCIAGHGDDYFSKASKETIIERLDNNKYEHYRKYMIDYLKDNYGYDYENKSDIGFWLDGDDGLKPYLRLKGRGMPSDKIDQIAWLLLNGSGCGFCKVCRDEPCRIKDGEKCTDNIANYIRQCVKDEEKGNKGDNK